MSVAALAIAALAIDPGLAAGVPSPGDVALAGDASNAGADAEISMLGYAVRSLAVLLLVLANGFFVAAEFALVGVRASRVATLAEAGDARAVRLSRMLASLDAYISATQLGITLASLALGWVGEETLSALIEPLLAAALPGEAASVAAHSISIAAAFAVITFLHIVLGELAPKTLALERAEAVALRVARLMELFYRAFKAPIRLLNWAGNVVVRAFGLRASGAHGAAYTEEELRYLVDASHTSGHLGAGERELIHNVFEFAGETVRDCMVPRAAVTVARDTAPVADLADAFVASGYSRMPVVGADADAVTGVLNGKDVFRASRSDTGAALARDLVRPAVFVPESSRLDRVLARMRRTGDHMVIVVDEHGGFVGILTIEDVLEEIVGEIRDELDGAERDPVARDADGSYVVDAGVSVRALNRRLGLAIPESQRYATLAGFLLAQTGSLVAEGEEIRFGGTRFVAERVRGNRIVAVRLHPAAGGKARPAEAAPDAAGEVPSVT